MGNRLHRSRKERMIAGVCGGLAKYFRIDPTLVRLAFVLLGLVNGLGVLIYLILWVIMPKEERVEGPPEGEESKEEQGPAPASRGLWAGGILILLGIVFLLKNLNLLWWFDWEKLWPLILIAFGITILVDRLCKI